MRGLLGALLVGFATLAGAHSASDAYLNVTAAPGTVGQTTLHGQWDIALRDLDFVLHLDADGDGHVTWSEVQRRQSDIERYAFSKLSFSGKNTTCKIKPGRQLIDGHADGAYSALMFDVTCNHAVKVITLKYDLFFAIDPSHRGIFVMQVGGNVSTAVLAPDNSSIALQLD